MSDPIDPKYDKAFKKIFGMPEKISVTKQLIQDVTDLKVNDISLLPTNISIDYFAQSMGIVDVLCDTPQGKILVEVQTYYQPVYKKPLLFYWSEMYGGQILTTEKEKGRPLNYEKHLRNVVIISISSLPIALKNPAYYSTHKIMDCKTHECEFSGLTFHLLDLTKFDLKINELTSNVDVWAYYFQNIHLLDEATVEKFREKHTFISDVVNQWQNLALTPDDYERYWLLHMSRIQDWGPGGDAALRADLEAAAEKRKSVEIAKKMLSGGRPIEEICAYTGLNKEDFTE